MAVYKFRVTFEEHDDVSRDIEIKSTQTFQELHQAIQQAIGFDSSKQASFFQSDSYWRKGEEYTLEPQKGKANMGETRLCDVINDPHQRFIYLFDPQVQWNFSVELIKIAADTTGVDYPRCVKKQGEAPKQHGASNLGAMSNDLDFLNETVVAHGGDDDEEISNMGEEGEEEEENNDEEEDFGTAEEMGESDHDEY